MRPLQPHFKDLQSAGPNRSEGPQLHMLLRRIGPTCRHGPTYRPGHVPAPISLMGWASTKVQGPTTRASGQKSFCKKKTQPDHGALCLSGRPTPTEEHVVCGECRRTPKQAFTDAILWCPSELEGHAPTWVYSTYRFHMLTQYLLLESIRTNDWFTQVDLKDAYFHIRIYSAHRHFLQFASMA